MSSASNENTPHESPHVSRETWAKVRSAFLRKEASLLQYSELLLWWNKKLNLSSRSSSGSDILKHIEHSMIPAHWIEESRLATWIDTGTGGGLPGIPLAIILPGHTFVLNDIVGKKMAAVKSMCSELKLTNVDYFQGDVADFEMHEATGVVSKHAFKIKDLLARLGQKKWERLLLLKGADYIEEMALLATQPSIRSFDLHKMTADPFYQGKFLLDICPTQPTAP